MAAVFKAVRVGGDFMVMAGGCDPTTGFQHSFSRVNDTTMQFETVTPEPPQQDEATPFVNWCSFKTGAKSIRVIDDQGNAHQLIPSNVSFDEKGDHVGNG